MKELGDALVSAVAILVPFAFFALIIWLAQRPEKPHPAERPDRTGYRAALETAKAATAYLAISKYARERHGLAPGAETCLCGGPAVCAERTALDEYAIQLLQDMPAPKTETA